MATLARPLPDPALRRAHRRVVLRLGAVVIGMFAFGFALVPLYDVFCELTGLNGKTGRIAAADVPAAAVDAQRLLTVEFVANLNARLPFEFAPLTRKLQIHPGAVGEVRYRVRNRSDRAVVARAVPSVAPALASRHFNKIECFCFTEQRLAPGEQIELPARFVIDPALPAEVTTMTLAYTFFAVPAAEQRTAAAVHLE